MKCNLNKYKCPKVKESSTPNLECGYCGKKAAILDCIKPLIGNELEIANIIMNK
jgi:hypothetical protein